MVSYPPALYYLEQLGFGDLILPFILFFAIVYAVLEKVDMFKDKKIKMVLALALALLAVLPHATGAGYLGGIDPVEKLNQILPSGVLILLVTLLVLVLSAVVGGPTGSAKDKFIPGTVGIVAFLAFLVVVLKAIAPDIMPGWLDWLGDPSMQALIVMVTIAAIVLYYISSPGSSTTNAQESFITKAKKVYNDLYG